MPCRHQPHLRLALALLALLACGVTQAQIRRCIGRDGNTVYTDRRCEDVDAVPFVRNAPARARPGYAQGCPRNLQDLVYRVTSAIDARDVNRLASVYDWRGQSTRSGYALMQRLDAIAQRPLADIVPVYPQPPPPPQPLATPGPRTGQDAAIAAGTPAPEPQASRDGGTDTGTDDDNYYPEPAVRRVPIALRLEQTLGASAAPARTVLGLRRAFGCWWVSL